MSYSPVTYTIQINFDTVVPDTSTLSYEMRQMLIDQFVDEQKRILPLKLQQRFLAAQMDHIDGLIDYEIGIGKIRSQIEFGG